MARMQSSRGLVLALAAVVAVVGVEVWRSSSPRRDANHDTELSLLRSANQQECARFVGTLDSAATIAAGNNPVQDGGPLTDDTRLALSVANGLEPTGKLTSYTFYAWLSFYDTCAFPRVWPSDAEGDAARTEFVDRLMTAKYEQGPKLGETLRRLHAIATNMTTQPYRRAWPKP